MADSPRAKQVISEALGRAMFDAPGYLRHYLNRQGYSHTYGMEIARRMIRELDHAGWRPKKDGREGVRELEDQICLGLSMADCARMASQDPSWSKAGRVQATNCIVAALGYTKVVLVKRNQK